MNKDNIPYIKYLMILNKVYEFIVENPHDSKFQDLISTINLYLSKKEKLLRLQKQIQKQFHLTKLIRIKKKFRILF